MQHLTDHLIIISLDCLSASDYSLLPSLTHFKTILQQGTIVRNVETIYPSLTYPCHATIVTGNYPSRHGIMNNTLFQPGKDSPDWNWHRRLIRGTTLYDEAKKRKMTVAALLWPITAKAKIDYNMPEIFANRPWKNQIAVSLFNGSPAYQLELNQRFGHLRNGLSQPQLDDFVTESTVHTIKTKKPNLLLVHLTDLDTQRHLYGFSSRESEEAIHRHNNRLGKILKALDESGIKQNSTIVIIGDHSALDENKAIKPNALFHQYGLLSVNKRGKLTNWRAYCQSCDGSSYIYLKDKKDSEAFQTVKKLLYRLLEDPESGIETILTGEEAAEKGADGSCSFMVEAKRGYYFLEDYLGEYIKHINIEDVLSNKKYTFAAHGYSPEKDHYTTILLAAGKGIKQDAFIPNIHLVDEGPTFARLLGFDLGDTDGRVIEELLNL